MKNPRSKLSENLGTMVCWYPDYELGDVDFTKTFFPSPEDFTAWLDVRCQHTKVIILPLFLYRDNGLHISIEKPENKETEQIGYIYVLFDEIKLRFKGNRVSRKREEKAFEQLKQEVYNYDKYINFIYNLPAITV